METTARRKPLLIYDGDCDFCALWVAHWRRLTGDTVDYAPFQEVERQFPDISHETFERGVQLILPDGRRYSSAGAVFRLLRQTPNRGWMFSLYRSVFGVALFSEWFYRRVAQHRSLAYHITIWLWGKDIGPHSHQWTAWLFLRLVGVIYLIAFASLSVQVIGLVGSSGILPVGDYLNRITANIPGGERYLLYPTLAWLDSSDAMLQLLCAGGIVLSILIILDILSAPVLALAWGFYLSLTFAGQTFLGFQWEGLLLETGFLAIFLGGWRVLPGFKGRREPSIVVIWLLRWLAFRLMFSSGMVKLLSNDPVWRNLTALEYHYWSQPIPNPVAWYVYQLPDWFHRLSTFIMFVIELVVPFLFFLPRRIRFLGALLTLFLQVMIQVSGNYTYFNLLAMTLCVPLLDDGFLRRPHLPAADTERGSSLRRTGLGALAAVIIVLSAGRFQTTLTGTNFLDSLPGELRDIAYYGYRWRMVSGYGLFARMTTTRGEILVEGSSDGEAWLPYVFRYKPDDLNRMPPFVAPHQPRLDWQMWFAALGDYQGNAWFVRFVRRLLEGSPEVLALLESNPFPDAPPRFIRARIANYEFTDWQTRNLIGAWWKREEYREYLPVVSLADFR